MKRQHPAFFLFLLILNWTPLSAQDSPEGLQVGKVTENIHVIAGAGGNIAVFTGKDGVFVIDDGMPNVVEPVATAIRSITAEPVRMIFNTHWHFDHAGGNEFFGKAGTLIVAHDNVRQRMSISQFSKLMNAEIEASPAAALPVVTFGSTVTFHLNGDTVTATHVPLAHTDGDAIVRFKNANVVHLGDLFFNGRYPVIDLSAGGSIQGMIAAAEQLLPQLGDDTKIIPGHGPMATRADYENFHTMLTTVSRRVQLLIDEGKTLEEIIVVRPSINFDDQWAWNFMPPDRWVTMVYNSLVPDAAAE